MAENANDYDCKVFRKKMVCYFPGFKRSNQDIPFPEEIRMREIERRLKNTDREAHREAK